MEAQALCSYIPLMASPKLPNCCVARPPSSLRRTGCTPHSSGLARFAPGFLLSHPPLRVFAIPANSGCPGPYADCDFSYTMESVVGGQFFTRPEERKNKTLRNVVNNGNYPFLHRGADDCALLFRPQIPLLCVSHLRANAGLGPSCTGHFTAPWS